MSDLPFDGGLRNIGDFLHKPTTLDKQPQRKQATKTSTLRSAKKADSWKDAYSVLIENKLHYRFAATTRNDEPFAPVLIPSPRIKAAATKVFVATFNDTWNHLSEFDQNRLLGYWHRPFHLMLTSDVLEANGPHPMIHIVDGPSSPEYIGCAFLGDLLTIPLGLVLDHPHRLQYEIARVLAMAYRYASRAHWRLIVLMLDDPQGRWDEDQFADDGGDETLDELGIVYVQEVEKQIAELLLRWRIGAS